MKIDVVMIGRRAGDVFLIKGEGERYLPEECSSELKTLAIFHAKHFNANVRENWYIVNVYTGMFVVGGSTKKKCLDAFAEKCPAYMKMVNDPTRKQFFDQKHEELQKLLKA